MLDLIYQATKDVVSGINRIYKNRVKKMPVGQFIKIVESKIGTKLSEDSKDELIQSFEMSGDIKTITSRNGKRYVLMGKII